MTARVADDAGNEVSEGEVEWSSTAPTRIEVVKTGSRTARITASGILFPHPMSSDPSSPHNHCMGNVVVIGHADGSLSLYAHLNTIDAVAGPIARGDRLGTVGASGCGSFGAHLHFEVKTPLA
jgi:murein DD-endopeptidase MepM/ murein hydrolase activator NlpD